jgi:hypothetical protein
MFFILKMSEDNKLTCYQSAERYVNLNGYLERNDIRLPELILLLREWVSFFIVLQVLKNNVKFIS